MPRAVEFLAWDKEKKHIETCIGVNPFYICDCDRKRWNPDQVELLQFTGLYDSKRTLDYPDGQKIYDGGILRYYSDARMIMPDGMGGWEYKGNPHLEERTIVEWSDEFAAFMVHGGSQFLYEVFGKSEVIGNIHADPELMEGWR